jgi:hypothetical protein
MDLTTNCFSLQQMAGNTSFTKIRYCELSSHKLSIFHDDTRTHLDCCVDLAIMRVELVSKDQEVHLHLHGVEMPLEVRYFTEY